MSHSKPLERDDWYLIFFLWPSCILRMTSFATGADLLILVGVVSLINAIRYSVIFLVIGVLCKLSSIFLGGDRCKISPLVHFQRRSIKALGKLSLHLFLAGIVAGFFVLISGYILDVMLPTLHETIEQWGIMIILLFLSPLDTLFWNDSDVFFNVLKLILINGFAYSLAALFIGVICNMFACATRKRLISS